MGSVAPSPFVIHIERDLKLWVPAGFRMPSLGGVGAMRAERPKRSTTVFYDSPDLALAAWGCLLRFRSGEGWTVKLPDQGAVSGLARPEQAFEGAEGTPPAAALAILVAFLRGRTVAPVARMRTARRRITFVDGATTILDLVDDRVSTADPEPRAMRQIEIELRDPAATDLRDEVVGRLVRAGAETGDRRTKYGWTLGARAPGPEVGVPKLGPRSTAGDAVRAALASGVIALVRRDAEIRASDDPEPVHQARVAVRRLRSDLRAFEPQLDAGWTALLRADLDWLGTALGTVRDKQVLAARVHEESREIADDADVRPVLSVLDAEIASARADLDELMRTERYFKVLDQLVAAARAPRLGATDGPASELLRPAVDRAWRRLRRAARRARAEPAGRMLHPVRIEAKRMRYMSEALAPIFGKRASRLARAANELQDVLGEHQDAVVARDWLRAHADADGVATAYTIGELAAMQLLTRDTARSRWPAAWKTVRRWRPTKWK